MGLGELLELRVDLVDCRVERRDVSREQDMVSRTGDVRARKGLWQSGGDGLEHERGNLRGDVDDIDAGVAVARDGHPKGGEYRTLRREGAAGLNAGKRVMCGTERITALAADFAMLSPIAAMIGAATAAGT